VIQPDGMADDFGWKAMAVVRVGWRGGGLSPQRSTVMECAMPQPNDLSRSLVCFEQEGTLVAVLELSKSSKEPDGREDAPPPSSVQVQLRHDLGQSDC
jgi:hypothetical protein